LTAYGELIKLHAKQLKLPTLSRYEEVLRQAEEQGWAYEQFLCELMSREVEQRQLNQQVRRMRAARFPLKKSLDDFDFKNCPMRRSSYLATCPVNL